MRAIRDRLRELYGRPVNEPHGHPIAELVRTVLSQNTSDTNRDVAYELHINLIRHGREVCRPRPRCDACGVRRMCPYWRRLRRPRD